MEKSPDCLPYNPNIPTLFGYRPSLVAGIIFMVLFSGVTIAHVWQSFRHRNIWLGHAFSLGAFGEFVGRLGRTVAYRCPYSAKLLEMQLAALIMAPAFRTAGIYGAVGGGRAGAAFSQNTSPSPGTYTMVAGILWQLASTCAFATLLEHVIYCGLVLIARNQALRRISLSLMMAVTCMVARGGYRRMELMNGWRGYLFTHEVYAITLDAAFMFIASLVLGVWNPANLILDARENARRMQAGVELRREQGAKK